LPVGTWGVVFSVGGAVILSHSVSF